MFAECEIGTRYTRADFFSDRTWTWTSYEEGIVRGKSIPARGTSGLTACQNVKDCEKRGKFPAHSHSRIIISSKSLSRYIHHSGAATELYTIYTYATSLIAIELVSGTKKFVAKYRRNNL